MITYIRAVRSGDDTKKFYFFKLKNDIYCVAKKSNLVASNRVTSLEFIFGDFDTVMSIHDLVGIRLPYAPPSIEINEIIGELSHLASLLRQR